MVAWLMCSDWPCSGRNADLFSLLSVSGIRMVQMQCKIDAYVTMRKIEEIRDYISSTRHTKGEVNNMDE